MDLNKPLFSLTVQEFIDLQTMIIELQIKKPAEDSDKRMTLDELCKTYGFAKDTIYGYVSKKKIVFEKVGKRLYFYKSQIEKWLKEKQFDPSSKPEMGISISKRKRRA